MVEICLNDLGTFPEDFILAKMDIENLLLENNEIQEKMDLENFILFLKIQDTVYINGTQTIAFKYIKGKLSDYLFYTFTAEKSKEEAIESLKEKLKNIKYDFNNLTKLNLSDFSAFDFDNIEMFLINQQFYK